MTRNLKALGLALFAAFAMSAVAASGASAQDVFTSDSAQESTFLTGVAEEPGSFITDNGNGAEVTCENATYDGTVDGNEVDQVTVHPEYSECHLPGIDEAVVDTEGCDYILTGKTSGGDAEVSIECTEGHEIIVTSSVCTLHIPPQTPEGGVSYAAQEENGKDTVTVTATVTGIEYSKTGGFCFLVPGNGQDAIYNDIVEVTGWEYSSATQDETSHEWEVAETNQVNIAVE